MCGVALWQLRVCQPTEQNQVRSYEPPGLLEQEVFLLLLVATVHLSTSKVTLVSFVDLQDHPCLFTDKL